MSSGFRKECFLPALFNLGNPYLGDILRYYPTKWSSSSSQEFIQGLPPKRLGQLVFMAKRQNPQTNRDCLSLSDEKCMELILKNRLANDLVDPAYLSKKELHLFLKLTLQNMNERMLAQLKDKIFNAYEKYQKLLKYEEEKRRQQQLSVQDIKERILALPINRANFQKCVHPLQNKFELALRDINAQRYNDT